MASCSSATPVSFNVQYFYSDQCFTCGDDCGPNVQNSKCVVYTGPNLSCSGIETNDSLEVALQKIDEQICSATGDYSTYQMNCLPTWWGEEISTESEFVDVITDYVCTLNDTVDTFINTTFVSYQSSVDTRFDAIEYPGITCAIAGVTNTDSLIQVLNKYCEEFEDIDTAIDITGIDWGGCFSVLVPPTSISEGFTYLLDLICDLNNNIQPLPTFDNSANCLAGTVEDSLETTVGAIITRLCQAPTWDSDNVTWGCITAPVDTGDLEEAVQNIVDVVNDLQQNFVTFDNSDFTVTATDGLDPCAGITVSLATPINQDRFVAVSAGDASPGTLFSKLSTPNSSVTITNVADTTVGLDVSTGDKGDITVSGGGNTWTIDNDTVTFAKMQNINTSRLIGRSTAGSGDPEEIQIGSGLALAAGVLSATGSGRTLLAVDVFYEDGSWSKPSGCNAVLVYTVGGGGGGAGANASTSEAAFGGGGGAGGFALDYIETGLNSTETVTVGVGGTRGESGNSYQGQSGGNSSFGAHTLANGGSGGVTTASGTTAAIGGYSGTGGSYTANGTTIVGASGGTGTYGIRLSASVAQGGWGGASYFGSWASGGTKSYGAGGPGNYAVDNSTANGIAGVDGIVIVYSFS